MVCKYMVINHFDNNVSVVINFTDYILGQQKKKQDYVTDI